MLTSKPPGRYSPEGDSTGPPGGNERRPRAGSGERDEDHGGGYVTASVTDLDDIAAPLRRRREASWRLPPLDCGYRDPLDHLRSAS